MPDPVLTTHRAGHFRELAPVTTRRTASEAMDYLLIWVLRGETAVELDGVPQRVAPGEVLTFEPGVAHAYSAPASGPWEWLWVHFGGEAAASMVAALRQYGSPAARLGWHTHIHERFVEVLLAEEASDGAAARPTAPLHAGASLYSLLALMLDQLELNRRLAREPGEAGSLDARAIQRYIHEHLAEPMRLEDLAEQAHLSPTHFARLFKSIFGTSPMRYVIERRIDRAADLLTTTRMKMAHIARTVGYEDPYYFSRLFRRVTGEAPSAYRRARQP